MTTTEPNKIEMSLDTSRLPRKVPKPESKLTLD